MSELGGPDISAEAPIDEADLAALRAVRKLYEMTDPVPTGLVERIQFAVDLENLDAEVARVCEESRLVGVRSLEEATETRTITFDCSVLTVMISIRPITEETVRIDGWLAPAGEHRVECRSPDGKRETTADPQGRFVVHDVPHGLLQMVIRLAFHEVQGGTPPVVVTPSIMV